MELKKLIQDAIGQQQIYAKRMVVRLVQGDGLYTCEPLDVTDFMPEIPNPNNFIYDVKGYTLREGTSFSYSQPQVGSYVLAIPLSRNSWYIIDSPVSDTVNIVNNIIKDNDTKPGIIINEEIKLTTDTEDKVEDFSNVRLADNILVMLNKKGQVLTTVELADNNANIKTKNCALTLTPYSFNVVNGDTSGNLAAAFDTFNTSMTAALANPASLASVTALAGAMATVFAQFQLDLEKIFGTGAGGSF